MKLTVMALKRLKQLTRKSKHCEFYWIQTMSANNNPALRYLNEFTKLKCAPDLLAWGLFPNAKEITESLGAYNAIRKHIRWDLGDPTRSEERRVGKECR